MNTAPRFYPDSMTAGPELEPYVVSALVDSLKRHVVRVNRDMEETALLIEENALALEVYLSLFTMNYVRACAARGVGSYSYIVSDVVPLLIEDGERSHRVLLRLRSPLPFPAQSSPVQTVIGSHEWSLQFQSLIQRRKSIDNGALITGLLRDLDKLKDDVDTECALFNEAYQLGVYVQRAIENMRFEHAMFVSSASAGELLL